MVLRLVRTHAATLGPQLTREPSLASGKFDREAEEDGTFGGTIAQGREGFTRTRQGPSRRELDELGRRRAVRGEER